MEYTEDQQDVIDLFSHWNPTKTSTMYENVVKSKDMTVEAFRVLFSNFPKDKIEGVMEGTYIYSYALQNPLCPIDILDMVSSYIFKYNESPTQSRLMMVIARKSNCPAHILRKICEEWDGDTSYTAAADAVKNKNCPEDQILSVLESLTSFRNGVAESMAMSGNPKVLEQMLAHRYLDINIARIIQESNKTPVQIAIKAKILATSRPPDWVERINRESNPSHQTEPSKTTTFPTFKSFLGK